MPGATDPDELLRALRQGAGDPPLPPLTLTPPARSARRGPAGAAVSGLRGLVLRLIAPSLAELIGQLERDRHRARAELSRLEARVAELEPPPADAGLMRVAFVVQRYGEEVAGGAEALCRATARALAAAGDAVEVHTTTARDYLTWAPHYPEGTTEEDGVTVHRHAAEPPDPPRADRLGKALALAPGDDDAERAWARAQGPVAPGLLRAVARAMGPGGRIEVAAAWTYLYATSQLAVPLAPRRTVLVPLAHDEPMLRFGVSRGLVRMAGGLAFMTPEERRLVEDLHGPLAQPSAVVGAGIDPAAGGDADRARSRFDLPRRFALYLGRVDPAKGLGALVRAHDGYRRAGGSYGLVVAGRPTVDMGLPGWVRTTGFVDARARADLLAAAEVVVLPSPHESLSLVALEAWSAGRATLATARSEVLAGQTARSSGGLLYLDDLSYSRQMSRLAADPSLRDMLGTRGARFAGDWTWDACVRRWRALLAQVRGPVAAPAVRR